MIPYGIEIKVSAYWPRNKPVMGTFTSRAHPLVEWLAKFLPFDPNTYFENVEIGKTWNDPMLIDSGMIDMFSRGGKVLMCSQEQANELMKVVRE